MALQTNFNTKHGVSANYHKVSSLHPEEKLRVDVFLSAAARDAGNVPLDSINNFDVPEGTFSEENLKQNGKSYKVLAYDYLKTLDMYDGATDV